MKKFRFVTRARNMRIRQKLFCAFALCILVMAMLCASMVTRFKQYEDNMATLLENQTLWGNYQNTLLSASYYLQHEVDIEDMPVRIRMLLEEMQAYADLMRTGFPCRAIEDLWYSTDSLHDLEDVIASLNTADGLMRGAPQIQRALQLIQLQYSTVNAAIHESTILQSAQIRQASNWNLQGYLALIASCTLFALVLTNQWARNFVRPLDRLVAAARDISWDRFDASILPTPVSNDEIGYLSCAFLDMADRIKAQVELIRAKGELERRLQEEHIQRLNAQKMRKESELMILQAEINPHFLFNSMNLIRQMAYLERAPETGEIAEALSSMLRYSLGCMHQSTTLHDELDNVQNYFFIQRKRFGSRIACTIQLQDTILKSARIPPMILQPLVENAYKHSLDRSGESFIRVLAQECGGRMHLIVEDNGHGFSPQRLTQVQDMLRQCRAEENTGTIGLKNVSDRLRLFFSGDSQISIESVQEKLTRVIIDVPIWHI